MYVYRHHGETLQPGMVNSMCESAGLAGAGFHLLMFVSRLIRGDLGVGFVVAYLYRDSEAWSSLKTLLWHNK